MYLHSTNNSLSKPTENVPVFLFCFEQRPVFMKRRETYEDMINALRIKFNIPDNANPILRVSTLEICNEREIEVDEDAYEAMAPFLDEIKIVLVPRSNDKGKGRYVTEDASPALTARRIPTEIKRVPSARTPKVVKAAELFANDDHLTDEGSQDTEETDATQPPGSPSSHESGRSWENVEESDTERRNTRKPFKADKSMMFVKQEVDEIVPPKASEPSGLNTSPTKKERPSGLGARNSSPRKERYEEPGSQDSGEDLDKYFEVTVIGPQDQRARLKARGRYQIRKVLFGVCKSFGICFDTARLIHVIKFVEDDGTESVEQFECDNDDTMAYCGIKENAQLAVIQREEDEESYDEDDDEE
ncbi:hypothetical protein EV421DRAFT_203405 [Armillaria borealis]|uniref:Uncharacterized protein n=1 Tax=Armillaria borealis TaxID=47425 RepID=A0AA39IV29_9AGAR|nr:hypothetical protein EV421DRAFT_203405 [Armillaria borealis]